MREVSLPPLDKTLGSVQSQRRYNMRHEMLTRESAFVTHVVPPLVQSLDHVDQSLISVCAHKGVEPSCIYAILACFIVASMLHILCVRVCFTVACKHVNFYHLVSKLVQHD